MIMKWIIKLIKKIFFKYKNDDGFSLAQASFLFDREITLKFANHQKLYDLIKERHDS